MQMFRHETLVLGGGAPVYVRESKEPEYLKKIKGFDFNYSKNRMILIKFY